jgi:hypothetical protein
MTVRMLLADHADAGVGRLGRHVEHDPQSWNFQAARATQLVSVLHHRRSRPFDQGDLGSCTGNALTGCLDTEPFGHSHLGERTALKLYKLATVLDGFPGEFPPDDTGSSGLAVCKAAVKDLYISAYHHAFGLQHALEALVLGPVITGVSWYEGFDSPDANGYVEIAGSVRGGHEFEVLGLDVDTRRVRCCNSWGTGWGDGGFFEMSFDTWSTLLDDRGDVTVPVV